MMSASGKQYPVKVSVVLPTYNQSQYLEKALQTVMCQTFRDFELIIVNDGSTDNTASLLTAFQHPQIHVITQTNKGLPTALNNGFAAARGEYWTWTSTDNIVATTWLEELVHALEDSPAEVGYACSPYAVIDEHDRVLHTNKDQRFDVVSLLMRHTGNASFLYRAELAKKIGHYDVNLNYAEDLDMWVRMAQQTRAVHVDKVLYSYRQHSQSMTTQQDKVRAASKGMIIKFLQQSDGKFQIDQLFPSIHLSKDPALERWKSRIWLSSVAASAHYYCPVDAVVDQLVQALREKYDSSLVGNLMHILIKEDRWEAAAAIVAEYQKIDSSNYLKKIADILVRKNKQELQTLPLATIEEKYLASDANGRWSQRELQRNFSSEKKKMTVENHPIHRPLYTKIQAVAETANYPYKVAVLMRTKNRLICLRRAVNSVLNQRFIDWQLVIINDGGDAAALDKELESFHTALRNRLLVIHNPTSKGMSQALNIGIDASSSELLVVHDDDDSWHPNFLLDTVNFLNDPENSDCRGVITYTNNVTEEIINNQIIHRNTQDFYSHYHPDTRVNFFRLLMQNTITTISFLFYRSVIKEMGYFNEDLPVLNDWDFNIRFLLRYDIGVVQKPLANYHFRHAEKSTAYGNSVLSTGNICLQYETRIRNKWLRHMLNSENHKEILGLCMALGGHYLNDMNMTKASHEITMQSPNMHTQVINWIGQHVKTPLSVDMQTLQKQMNHIQGQIDTLLKKQSTLTE